MIIKDQSVAVAGFEAPLVQILPDGGLVSVRSGNSVQLQCRVIGGYPSPTVTWRREAGQELSQNVEVLAGGNLRYVPLCYGTRLSLAS